MNARTLRRAAERKARKLAQRASVSVEPAQRASVSTEPAQRASVSVEPAEPAGGQAELVQPAAASAQPSPARLAANRANAQNSTGPKTNAGKERSKLNAVKTALTGRTVLLPGDDAARYQAHVESWVAEYQPVGLRESVLVQAIADSYWRTERIVRLEFAFFAAGRSELEGQFAQHDDAAQRDSLIEMHTLLRFEKQLHNLQLQESRILRQRNKDQRELAQLQAERRERAAALQENSSLKAQGSPQLLPLRTVPTDGLEFSSRPLGTDLAFQPTSASTQPNDDPAALSLPAVPAAA